MKKITYKNRILNAPVEELPVAEVKSYNQIVDEKLANLNAMLSKPSQQPIVFNTNIMVAADIGVSTYIEFDSKPGTKSIKLSSYKSKVINSIVTESTRLGVTMKDISTPPGSILLWIDWNKESITSEPLSWFYRITVGENPSDKDFTVDLEVTQDETGKVIPITVVQKASTVKWFYGVKASSHDISMSNIDFKLGLYSNPLMSTLFWENTTSEEFYMIPQSLGGNNLTSGLISNIYRIEFGLTRMEIPESGYTHTFLVNNVTVRDVKGELLRSWSTNFQVVQKFSYNESMSGEWVGVRVVLPHANSNYFYKLDLEKYSIT